MRSFVLAVALVVTSLTSAAFAEGKKIGVAWGDFQEARWRWDATAMRSMIEREGNKYLPTNASALSAWVHKHHPYSIPQLIEFSAENVGEKYLSWAIANSTSLPFQQTKSP